MADAKYSKLMKLRAIGGMVADQKSDIRGRKVMDRHGRSPGKVRALLVDEEHRMVRFFEVDSGGILGLGSMKFLIPFDAITGVTDSEVHIYQEVGNVAGAPAYDPALIDHAKFFEDTYGHYGMLPFWDGAYTRPTYPGRDPLDGK